jgi:hypothetical protein
VAGGVSGDTSAGPSEPPHPIITAIPNTNDSAAKDFKSCIDYSLKINGLFQLGALFIAYVWDKYYVNCLRQGQGEEEM